MVRNRNEGETREERKEMNEKRDAKKPPKL